MKNFKIQIEVSARHCHLSQSDFKKLFGPHAELKPWRFLSQEGEFASDKTIDIQTKKGQISKLRIIGPLRSKTQLEISGTDAVRLGLTPPVRMSGDLEGSSGATLSGPAGTVRKKEGVILAHRHIHANPEQARKYGLKKNKFYQVEVKGERALIFDKVLVKTHENFSLSMHIDTDEANAAGIGKKGITGLVVLE